MSDSPLEIYIEIYNNAFNSLNPPTDPIQRRMIETVFKVGFKQKFGEKYPSPQEFYKDITDFTQEFKR